MSQVSQAFVGIGISPNAEIDDAAVARYLVEPFVRPVRSGDTKLGFPVSANQCEQRLASPLEFPELLRIRMPNVPFIKIGRASCRERVCQYVSISVVAVSLKKTTISKKT